MKTFSYFFIIILGLFTSCHENEIYPSIISDLKLTNKYDSAKWFITYLHYDYFCTSEGNITNKQLINFDLAFDTIEIYGKETLEIRFDFVLDKKKCLECTSKDSNEYHLFSTVGYINGKAEYLKSDNTCATVYDYEIITDATNYKKNNDFINFLNANKKILNKWILNESQKRGLLIDE